MHKLNTDWFLYNNNTIRELDSNIISKNKNYEKNKIFWLFK